MSEIVNLSNLSGKAMLFGEEINTDIIIPSKYLEESDPRQYSKYVMAAIRPTTWQEIQDQGDTIFVADYDFGSGSSREQAPEAIKFAGVKAVVAESFATIFYRNCMNIGFPILEVPGVVDNVSEGDALHVDIETATFENKTTGVKLQGNKIEEFLLVKLRKGGLIPELQAYVKKYELDQ